MSELSPNQLDRIKRRTGEIGQDLLQQSSQRRAHLLQRRWWDDRLMNWVMNEEALKIQLFRFIDVLPMLLSDHQVVRHLQEYLSGVRHRLPLSARAMLAAAGSNRLGRRLLSGAARRHARSYARRFIAGTTTDEVMQVVRQQRELGCGFTLDLLGEEVTSHRQATHHHQQYLDLISNIAPQVNAWPQDEKIDRGVYGLLPRMNLSIKLSALDCHFDAIDTEGTTERVSQRLRELLRAAQANNTFVNVDMESYDKKDLTLHIFQKVLMEDEFRKTGDVGIVIQCYLQDAASDLEQLRDWSKKRGHPVWVRLVKGAYWDYETIHATANGWPIPVWQQKWQSDAEFERQTCFVMQNIDYLRPAIASHNLRSLAHALATAEVLELPERGFEIQMLYGMADNELQALAQHGHRLRVYMPCGELIPGMAYLVRRLLENSSNESFLRSSSLGPQAAESLLQDPREQKSSPTLATENPHSSAHVLSPSEPMSETEMAAANPLIDFTSTFSNEPPIDFTQLVPRQAMQESLQKVRQQFGKPCDLIIGEKRFETTGRIESRNPSNQLEVVAVSAAANLEQAELAVAAAKAALPQWRRTPVEKRAAYLRRVAQLLRDRFFEIAAWEVYECGKPWREATGDVCEAIDFCEYYATGAEAIEAPQGHDLPGEGNRFSYQPCGVTAVIAPWNFPLAIITGMTAAAIATGNTVVMKPAEQSPATALLLMEVFQQAGLPPGVVNYLPGYGDTVGEFLVEHPDVALIAFTGSRSVGLSINRRAAKVSASSTKLVKRVLAEMGGKNAILVDDDADLDETIQGAVVSAFGFQGQKCSACSRLIVHEGVYDAVLDRIAEATKSLVIGVADDPATQVGPVIDAQARDKALQYIANAHQTSRSVVAVDVGSLGDEGYFVGPHIFADVAPNAPLAQEEIFGPVLAVIRATDFDNAIQIANATDYALTAGVYSRSPAHLELAARELEAGNIYLNRETTGAIVSRQPFGGYRLSGIGSKAGGPDYLRQFVVPRTVTENTMRRGFAPGQ